MAEVQCDSIDPIIFISSYADMGIALPSVRYRETHSWLRAARSKAMGRGAHQFWQPIPNLQQLIPGLFPLEFVDYTVKCWLWVMCIMANMRVVVLEHDRRFCVCTRALDLERLIPH